MTDTVPSEDQVGFDETEAALPPDALEPVFAQIRKLNDAFNAKIRYDEVRERMVESLVAELEGYRQNQQQQLLRPVLLDLVTMHDDLTKVIETADAPATVNALRYFQESVEQALARNEVEAFTVAGEMLDRTRQKVVSVVDTADPSYDRRVASRLRPGFFWHDKVLRHEWVTVYRLIDPPAAPAPTASETTEEFDAASIAALPSDSRVDEGV